MYFLFWKNKQVPWLGRENKSKPWQPRNLQKYNKKKQEYNNKYDESNAIVTGEEGVWAGYGEGYGEGC